MVTKIYSKRQKRRSRRGRPRIEGKLREPNGRISRAKDPAARVALEARARHAGLNLAQAVDPRAENYIGHLAILGRGEGLSQDQYDAAVRFLEIRNDYRRSLLSPGAYYEVTGLRLGAENMQEYTGWCKRVRRRYTAALKAVQEAQFDNGCENLYAALQYVIIDGLELAHLLGATRMVLNALHRHFQRQVPARRNRNYWERYNISLGRMTVLSKQGGAG